MKRLRDILEEYETGKANLGEGELSDALAKFLRDLRYGYLFQLGIIALIFILTTCAVAAVWRDSAAIAGIFGAIGIGGVGWFLKEVRNSMREYAFVQVLLEGSRSLSDDKREALITLVANRLVAA